MYKEKCIKKIILSIAICFIMAFGFLLSPFAMTFARAENISHSNVLDDLRKDSTFDETLYPAYTYEEIKNTDLKLLDVISIAESQNDELYLYVYNPTRDDLGITAYQVSMYCSFASNPKDFSPTLYDLSLVSFEGCFDKYLVKGFTVTHDAERYYNIIEISRPFNSTIDTSIDNGTTDDKAIPVGKQWSCYYYNDVLVYEMATFNVLEITPTLNGNIFYNDGITWGTLIWQYEKCNSHFIAFNCDNYIVEHIFDADLNYNFRKVHEFDSLSDETTYGEWSSSSITLTDQDTVTYEGPGLFSKEYNWNRIMTAEDFVENFESQGGVLNETSKDILLQSQWVFAFVETEYSEGYLHDAWGSKEINYTEVADVDILRIHFMDNTGKFYNLGVVGDKTTADDIPDGSANKLELDLSGLWEDLKVIFAVLAVLIAIAIFLPILSPLISFIFKLIFEILLFVLTAPIKLLNKLLGKRK